MTRIVEEKGLAGERIGLDLTPYRLTGVSHERVRCPVVGSCRREDTSSYGAVEHYLEEA